MGSCCETFYKKERVLHILVCQNCLNEMSNVMPNEQKILDVTKNHSIIKAF